MGALMSTETIRRLLRTMRRGWGEGYGGGGGGGGEGEAKPAHK